MKCTKCNGTGVLNEYLHIDNGKCFECNGTGKVEVSEEVQKRNLERDQWLKEREQKALDIHFIAVEINKNTNLTVKIKNKTFYKIYKDDQYCFTLNKDKYSLRYTEEHIYKLVEKYS